MAQQKKDCPLCKGNGKVVRCLKCKGKGYELIYLGIHPKHIKTTCSACQGLCVVAAPNIKEAGRTVRAERPVQQRKAKILLCSGTSICACKTVSGNCNYLAKCPWQRKTSAVA
jgi:hypothetical protein